MLPWSRIALDRLHLAVEPGPRQLHVGNLEDQGTSPQPKEAGGARPDDLRRNMQQPRACATTHNAKSRLRKVRTAET
jgi:hypothetical protein